MSDTNQTIQKFYTKAISQDFARDINFRLLSLSLGGVTLGEDDLVYARSGRVPAREIVKVDVPYSGLTFKVPGTVVYPDADGYEIEFYCDEASSLRKMFEAASRRIFDEQTTTGNYDTPDRDNVLTIGQLDKDLNVISKYELIGAWVQKVGELEYQLAEGSGEVVNFKVTLSFQYFNESAT
tara:strand:+ start:1979 stop:2521 length:543 start_codon:yes stop_codon:yes gene_type:complete